MQVLPSTCNLSATSCCFVPKSGAVCVAACDVEGSGNLSCAVVLRTRLRQVAGATTNSSINESRSNLILTRILTEAAARSLAAALSLVVCWGQGAPSLKPLGSGRVPQALLTSLFPGASIWPPADIDSSRWQQSLLQELLSFVCSPMFDPSDAFDVPHAPPVRSTHVCRLQLMLLHLQSTIVCSSLPLSPGFALAPAGGAVCVCGRFLHDVFVTVCAGTCVASACAPPRTRRCRPA
jgi:hypothetical protein